MSDESDPLKPFAPGELGQAMLRAAATEQPDRAALKRTLAALGTLGVATTATATVQGMSALLKWGIGAGVCAFLAVGAVALERMSNAPSSAAPAVAQTSTSASDAPPSAEPPATETAEEPAAPTPEATATTPPAVASSAAPAKPAASSLALEVAAMNAAGAKLSRGDAKGCLAELDAYQRTFPRGALAQEATVMRIEALVRSGDRAGARRLADRFLPRDRVSPYAARIRSLLGDESNP